MKFMPYEKSLEILAKNTIKWDRIEKVTITNALNRYLAIDIIAKDNYPSHPTSAMDGYAIKHSEIENGSFTILGDVPAGALKDVELGKFECIKTFTGSLMSKNSDTLVPVENVEVFDNTIKIIKEVPKGFAVREIGESYKKGEILIKKGTKLSYSEIALLAELGEIFVSVYIKPKVAILATGSEIKDIGEPLENEAQIRSSNHVALKAMMELMGCEPMILPIVKDEPNLVENAILQGLRSCDILLTTGGVSMGDYDFVKTALSKNCNVIINGAAIKPGRHIKISKIDEKYIFSLPGFPYSAMVMCILYVRVLINSFFSINDNYEVNAVMDSDFTKKSKFLEFSACTLYADKKGILKVSLKGKKDGSSAIVNNLNQNAALLITPLESTGHKKGDVVKVLKMV
ncbi:molybdopterin molybdenumtransferase [Campylobacter blaseri]|uniref:Molybdopterin molybdenumtransferase n=1 Tax=Campylobacter blaseri TaxID=2042961 RepID=A0A2P8R455_9BACT|nr:molybdopterin molybdotransferase MoeA [Campylobacter blaseri]PSM53294.1 molybdopterin molybdenumtransferase MoeA [Campylobacter blaseri]PSM54760.1 molybdopterin molybdenumtransferase MoeA [Campylobacter blaseri]QKF86757.1 molybdopterin molybdenumtransferase [Campylobacter blaseri]